LLKPGSFWAPLNERGPLGDVPHEGRLLQDEVVRGKDDHRGLGIAGVYPVGGQENAGGGAPIPRLSQHVRSAGIAELRREVAGVVGKRHDHRPFRGNRQDYPVKSLAEQRP
jgi:hypothetical protein